MESVAVARPLNHEKARVNELVPQYLRGSTENIITFLKEYYAYLSDSQSPSSRLENLVSENDIDETSAAYLDSIQAEIAAIIPNSPSIDRVTLYKRIVHFYRSKGTTEAVSSFFRIFFNDTEYQIFYPVDGDGIPIPYRYRLRTNLFDAKWKEVYKRLVHPAGLEFILVNPVDAVLRGGDGDPLVQAGWDQDYHGKPRDIFIDSQNPDWLYRLTPPYLRNGDSQYDAYFMSKYQPGWIKDNILKIIATVPDDSQINPPQALLETDFSRLAILMPIIVTRIDDHRDEPVHNEWVKQIKFHDTTGMGAGYQHFTLAQGDELFTGSNAFRHLAIGSIINQRNVSLNSTTAHYFMTFAAPESFSVDMSDTSVVSVANDTIKIPLANYNACQNGDEVIFDEGTASDAPDFADNTTYFIIKTRTTDATTGTIKLASTYSNAIAGTAINITSLYTKNVTSFSLDLRSSGVIDVGNDTITVPSDIYTLCATGDTLRYDTGGASDDPDGLADDTTYFIIKTGTANEIKLALTLTNAKAGTAVNIIAVSTATQYDSNADFLLTYSEVWDSQTMFLFTGKTATGHFNVRTAALPALLDPIETTDIVIDDGGSLYTSAPTVTFTSPAGTIATGTAVISNGKVTGVNVTGGGTYDQRIEEGNDIEFSLTIGQVPENTLVPFTITGEGNFDSDDIDIPLTGSFITNPAKYTPFTSISSAPDDYIYYQDNVYKNVAVDAGVTYDSQSPTVTISGGGGSGAAAFATINNGRISSIVVTNGGSEYTSNPALTITIADPASIGIGEIDSQGGLIESSSYINITNNGDGGYDSQNPPNVVIAAPTKVLVGYGGRQATATATVNAQGDVAAINIADPGLGYDASLVTETSPSIPVTIDPPDFDGQQATAVIDGSTFKTDRLAFLKATATIPSGGIIDKVIETIDVVNPGNDYCISPPTHTTGTAIDGSVSWEYQPATYPSSVNLDVNASSESPAVADSGETFSFQLDEFPDQNITVTIIE